VKEPVNHKAIGRDVTAPEHFVAPKPHSAIVSKVTDSVRRSHVALQRML
jgi:hypothetical protein